MNYFQKNIIYYLNYKKLRNSFKMRIYNRRDGQSMAELLSGSDEATKVNKRNAMAQPSEPTYGHGRILGNIDATNVPRRNNGRRGNSLVENQNNAVPYPEQNRENFLPSLG